MPNFTVRKVVTETKTVTITKTYEAQMKARDEDAAQEKATDREEDEKFWGEPVEEDTDDDSDTEFDIEVEEADDE